MSARRRRRRRGAIITRFSRVLCAVRRGDTDTARVVRVWCVRARSPPLVSRTTAADTMIRRVRRRRRFR